MPEAESWATLDTFTILEGALSLSLSSRRLVSRKWPTWLVPNANSNPLAVNPRWPATPALLTSAWSGSSRLRNSLAHWRTESRSPRSSWRDSTLSPSSSRTGLAFSSERAVMKTLAPRCASSVAVARPMPLLAPVTRNVRPLRSCALLIRLLRSSHSLSFHPSHQGGHRPRVVAQAVPGAGDHSKVSLPMGSVGQRPCVADGHGGVLGPVHQQQRTRRHAADADQGLHLLELAGPRLHV